MWVLSLRCFDWLKNTHSSSDWLKTTLSSSDWLKTTLISSDWLTTSLSSDWLKTTSLSSDWLKTTILSFDWLTMILSLFLLANAGPFASLSHGWISFLSWNLFFYSDWRTTLFPIFLLAVIHLVSPMIVGNDSVWPGLHLGEAGWEGEEGRGGEGQEGQQGGGGRPGGQVWGGEDGEGGEGEGEGGEGGIKQKQNATINQCESFIAKSCLYLLHFYNLNTDHFLSYY